MDKKQDTSIKKLDKISKVVDILGKEFFSYFLISQLLLLLNIIAIIYFF